MRRSAVLAEVEVRLGEDEVVAGGFRRAAAAAPLGSVVRGRRRGGLRGFLVGAEVHLVVRGVVVDRGGGRRGNVRGRRGCLVLIPRARGLVLESVQLLRRPPRGVKQASVLQVAHRPPELGVLHLATRHGAQWVGRKRPPRRLRVRGFVRERRRVVPWVGSESRGEVRLVDAGVDVRPSSARSFRPLRSAGTAMARFAVGRKI